MAETSKQQNTTTILTELTDVMMSRRHASPDSSYVAQLLHAGEDKILKKIIEEAGEVLMAAKDGDQTHLIKEIADLWFHTMVLLTSHELRVDDVLNELQRRQHVSGLTEKASRQSR